ncbi:MAG TPA: YhfC family glutamic-type intramembrane protease [Chloroflexota bacterium]|nr:YhfC family glutamic-type intramembrane protease [Chloroflexota bacterium]
MAFHFSSTLIAAWVFAIVVMIVYPLALAVLAHRRLDVSWRYFGYGALVFLVAQVVLRIPIITALGLLVGRSLSQSVAIQLGWGLFLAITAGIFEEVGRYLGYRWLMRRQEKTWNKGVMYGLGHGGFESIVLVAVSSLATLVTLLTLSQSGLGAMPPAQRAALVAEAAALTNGPAWLPLLAAWERIWTVAIQVANSVIVLQVFRRGQMYWLWLAILDHGIVDFVSPVLVPKLGLPPVATTLVSEAFIGLFGLVAVWIIFRLRKSGISGEHSPA